MRLACAAALALLMGCTSGFPAGADDPDPVPTRSEATAVAPTTAPAAQPSSPTPAGRLPSPSLAPTDDGPVAPSSAAIPSPGRLGPDTLAVVIATDGLRVRSRPTVGSESRKLEPLLDEGVRLYVVDGPVTEDGYAWYQVQPYGEAHALPFGWVAGSDRDGEPWIESFGLGCDAAAPTAETLAGGEPLEHLYCSLAGETPRSRPPGPDIELEADVYCTLADDHWGPLSGPAWIEQIGFCELVTAVGSLRVPGTPLTRSLGGPTNPVEGRYAIVGHFDDPGAPACRMGSYDGPDTVEPAQAVLECRTYFVVTAARALP